MNGDVIHQQVSLIDLFSTMPSWTKDKRPTVYAGFYTHSEIHWQHLNPASDSRLYHLLSN